MMHRKQCSLHQFTTCRKLRIFLPLHNPRQQLAALTHRECGKEELFPFVAEVKLHGEDYTIKDGAPPRTPDQPCLKAHRRPLGYFLFGISPDEPILAFTQKKLRRIFDAARSCELKPITIWSYLHSLKTIFARWTLPYYADKKWSVPKIDLPSFRRSAPRYVRPDSTILAKVKNWYVSLEDRPDGREWVLATLMLEFAMRILDLL